MFVLWHFSWHKGEPTDSHQLADITEGAAGLDPGDLHSKMPQCTEQPKVEGDVRSETADDRTPLESGATGQVAVSTQLSHSCLF